MKKKIDGKKIVLTRIFLGGIFIKIIIKILDSFCNLINIIFFIIYQITGMLATFSFPLLFLIIQYSLLYAQAKSNGMVIIAQSGTNTIITSPTSANATLAAYPYPHNITQNPTAKWIWYGPGNDNTCPMQITITQSFTMKCLNQPLYFYVAANHYYTATIGNYILSGSDWSSPNNYTLSTTGLTCGILYNKLGTQLTWTVVANNVPDGTNNCLNNPAGLIFSILSPDCTCPSALYVYDPSVCGCAACKTLLVGCTTCNSTTFCTTCNASQGYKPKPANGICTPNSGYNIIVGCNCASKTQECPDQCGCNTLSNFVNVSKKCVCASGYALNGDKCESCSTFMTNCATCNSTTVCNSCVDGYNLGIFGCQSCSSLIHCKTCSSSLVCTTCDSSSYTVQNNVCVSCGSILTGCLTCRSSNVCMTCDTANNFQLGSNVCICKSGYTLNGLVCQFCNVSLSNCNTCSSQLICTTCNINYKLINNVCTTCNSFINGCSSCNTTNCLSCDSTNGFMANLDIFGKITSCTCKNNSYYFYGNTCNLCDQHFPGCGQCQILFNSLFFFTCIQCLGSYQTISTNGIITSCTDCSLISIGCISCSTGPICNTCDATLFYNPTPNGNTCDCVNSSYVKMPSNNCVACNTISALGSCSQCLSTTVCTACINNAYAIDTNNVCSVCSTLITGCLTCDSSTNCLTCDLTDYVPSGLTPNTCICNSLSTMNNSVCTLCSSLISNCITCSNYQTCTTCISLYTNSSGNCVLCSSIIALGPCINCSSSTTCTVCQTNYFPDNSGVCQLCNNFMPSCTSCSNSSTCLTCVKGLGVNLTTNNSCSSCSSFMIGCLQCTNSITCTKCDFNGFFVKNSNNSCSCVDSLVYQNSVCTTCSQSLSNCISCTSSTICTACSFGYYVNQNNNCQVCAYGCLVCTLASGCSICDSTLPISLIVDANNYGSCNCTTGYVLNTADPNNNYCQSTCGDGYLIYTDEQCDDNNMINGDGCSSLCVVQTNYICTNNPVDLSICCYTQPFNLTIQSIVKQPDSNTLTFTMQIGPNISSLTSVNFSNIISSNVSLSNPVYTYSPNGTLTISYNYNTTLQGQPASFNFDPTLAGSDFQMSSPSNISLILVSSNNLPIAFYNQSVYDDSKKYKDAYLAAQVISYIILAAGMSCNKIVGVQLFGALQVAFFSVSTINQVQPLLQPIRQLKTVNGINSQFNFNSSSVPDRVKGIGYQAPFLSNFNYMFWLVIGQIFTGVSFIIAGKLISSFSQKLEKIGKKMLKEYLLMLALFNILNISYSAGLQFTYDDTLFSANSAIAVLAMVVPVVIGLVYTFSPADNDDFGQFKSYFKPNYVCKSYFLFTIVYRAILGICMSQMNEMEQATIITFIISMFYFMFLISNLPFKKGYQNYRTVICQISVMISLFISMYYRSMKSTTDPSISSQILSPAFLQVFGIFSSVTVSSVCLCYQIYLKYIKKSPVPQSKQKSSNQNKRETNISNFVTNSTQNMDISVDQNIMISYIQ